jgi:hypothetical protein
MFDGRDRVAKPQALARDGAVGHVKSVIALVLASQHGGYGRGRAARDAPQRLRVLKTR